MEMPNGGAKLRAMNRFRIRLAALYCCPGGTLSDLADLIQINYATLKSQVLSERCLASPDTKMAIIRVVGIEFVPPDKPLNGDWSNLC